MGVAYGFAIIGGIANSFLDTCVSPTCMEIYVNNGSVANMFTKFSMCISQFLLPFMIGFVASANMSYRTIFMVAGAAILIDGILILFLPFPARNVGAAGKVEKKEEKKSKLKVGIIGAGRIGRVHITSISTRVKDAQIKTVADPFLNDETAEWAKSMGVEHTTKDYMEIINDPEIDAVLICSSTDTHSPISLEAIKAGKHVFCEKPIDHDVDKIKEVIEALEGTNLKYQVGFNRRFDHNFEAVQRAVAAGKVGKPEIIKITSRDPEPPSIDYVKVSGGMFLDMTIHDFDMVRFLAGCDATEVYVQGANLVDPAIGEAGDVDTAVITLQMENGAIAVIDNCRKAVYGYDQRAEVFGSEGMVAVSNDSQSSAVVSNAEGVTGEKPMFFFLERYMEAYGKEISDFIDAIVNDKETPLNVIDGLKPVLMGLAAQKSLEEHRPVKISEIM